MRIENRVVSKDAQMGLGDARSSKVRVLKLLQSPIVPDARVRRKSFHVDRANGIRRDPQPRDDLQQATPLEDDLPVHFSGLLQRIAKGSQIEPIQIAPTPTFLYRVTVCTDEIRIAGLRELSCQKGFSRSTESIDADGPSLLASRTHLSFKGIDIREELHSATNPQIGPVKFQAQFQQFLSARLASLLSHRTVLADNSDSQFAERNS